VPAGVDASVPASLVVAALVALADLVVLAAEAASLFAMLEFAADSSDPADEVASLLVVPVLLDVEPLPAAELLAGVAVVAAVLPDCFGVVLALVFELAASLLVAADAEASGLGEGSALGRGSDVEEEAALLAVGSFVVLVVALFMPVSVGVALFVAVPLSVGAALLLVDGVAVVVGVALFVGVGLLVGVALLVGVGLLVGVELLAGVGLLVGLALFVGVGFGDLVTFTNSHCCVVPLTRDAVGVGVAPAGRLDGAADAATVNPAAAAMTTPLVTRPTPSGRTCAKRFKALPVLFVAAAERPIQYEVAASDPNARLVGPPLHTKLAA
jgi:hypothetical protein